ncbi:MAG: hypothetical protein A3G32_07390 [Deltaproteobacteria bacterium RIFCSPLOWO2_12_FULL_40_28]|nr:MAG: hypothetical protein A3C45_07435 [Deltaproteobacteria bacterium RIFCSPHIGHO2_02_FULL_40_28]OGQ19221.1 MAG: hypothetical protein A3E27_04380 [Deltaproteobacteria bacterium RIFCSPHIGHO2_12_FULL_40_32]OGQ40555.1 MAG: hypothetical protein A3I69_00690 [Deltaproteobacteria bacterium RIFCSPLOWO2_02_FULL_40_36]OGQ53790.1 MAG: hypothetical protein A3G32_07390 [Deltaproteobacteria bacterium RIFCSPLOWO2_12_FULL_40_28]
MKQLVLGAFCVFVLLSKPVWAQTPQISATPPSPAQPQNTMITQMGTDGTYEVDAKQAKISDSILTLVLSYRNTSPNLIKITPYKVDEVYYIDGKEQKKYHVLKDEKGEWIASPVARGMIAVEETIAASGLEIPQAGQKMVWFKFPAPPATTNEININIPGILPFEKVPVSR